MMFLDRITDPTGSSIAEIEKLIVERGSATVQFSEPPENLRLLAKVDALCQKYRDALRVRFYGHYSGAFNAALLKHVPNVQNLALDCLFRAERLEELYGLTELKRLSLGIFELKDAEILAKIDIRDLREFSIGETRSTKIDLSPLSQCQNLESVWIEAQPKGMEAVGKLPKLAELTLRRIGKDHPVGFVSGMPALKRLKVILGGRDDIDEISHDRIERLEVIWIRGLTSLGDLGRFPSIQELSVEDQLQLRALDLAQASKALRRLTIVNCKNLATVGSLARLGALEEVVIGRTAVDCEALVGALPKSVHTVRFWEGRRKRDVEIRAKLDALGYKDHNRPPKNGRASNRNQVLGLEGAGGAGL